MDLIIESLHKVNEAFSHMDRDTMEEEIGDYMRKSKENFNKVCDYIDNELEKPNKGISQLNKREIEYIYAEFIESLDESTARDSNFIEEIEKCTTEKQVRKVLSKYKVKIVRDDSEELGSFSVWISDYERIYKPYKRKNMVYQKHKKVDMTYSGVPTFFGTDSYF